jgi:prepilin-type N-terminal cleavage/methylation domain-containing protein
MLKYNLKIFKAFTLAEVLITLLIIGVVAGIIVPSLIQDSQDAEFKVAYKKAYAVAANVIKLALINNELTPRSGGSDPTATAYNWNVFKSYFSVSKDCSNNNNDQCWDPTGELMEGNHFNPIYYQPNQNENAFIDNSGMAWSLYSNNENLIIVDTNGFKGPNRYGKDRWVFGNKDASNNYTVTGIPSKLGPYSNSDVTGVNYFYCHYPPCYFKSWLIQ